MNIYDLENNAWKLEHDAELRIQEINNTKNCEHNYLSSMCNAHTSHVCVSIVKNRAVRNVFMKQNILIVQSTFL